MKKEDLQFLKECDSYYHKLKGLIKNGKDRAASMVMKDIELKLRQWQDHEKLVKVRINMMKALYVKATVEQRKASMKKLGGSDNV